MSDIVKLVTVDMDCPSGVWEMWGAGSVGGADWSVERVSIGVWSVDWSVEGACDDCTAQLVSLQ